MPAAATGARSLRTRSALPAAQRGPAPQPTLASGRAAYSRLLRRTAGKDKAEGEADAEGGDDAADKAEPEPEPDNVRARPAADDSACQPDRSDARFLLPLRR